MMVTWSIKPATTYGEPGQERQNGGRSHKYRRHGEEFLLHYFKRYHAFNKVRYTVILKSKLVLTNDPRDRRGPGCRTGVCRASRLSHTPLEPETNCTKKKQTTNSWDAS